MKENQFNYDAALNKVEAAAKKNLSNAEMYAKIYRVLDEAEHYYNMAKNAPTATMKESFAITTRSQLKYALFLISTILEELELN